MRSSKAVTPIRSTISACIPRATGSVVRAFLPEASNVEAIGEHGETAPLARIHDAGLFAGALPNGSKRYQLRARFGDNVVDLDDPYRFPPVLSDFDLYLLGEGTHQRIYDKLGAHPMTLDGVAGVGLRRAGAECHGASAWSAISISGIRGGTRCGCAATAIGSCSCPHAARRRSLQVRDHRPARPACCR